MVKVMRSLAVTTASLFFSGWANATLIGDTVDIDIQPNGTFWSTSATSVVVGPGIESTLSLQGIPFFSLDLTESSIIMTELNNPFGYPFFFGEDEVLTISDMDWIDSPGNIVGFDIFTQGWSGIEAADVSFTNDSVTLFFNDGAAVDVSGAVLTIDLHVEHVPEPTTLALMGFGLAGIGFTRRRIRMKA